MTEVTRPPVELFPTTTPETAALTELPDIDERLLCLNALRRVGRAFVNASTDDFTGPELLRFTKTNLELHARNTGRSLAEPVYMEVWGYVQDQKAPLTLPPFFKGPIWAEMGKHVVDLRAELVALHTKSEAPKRDTPPAQMEAPDQEQATQRTMQSATVRARQELPVRREEKPDDTPRQLSRQRMTELLRQVQTVSIPESFGVLKGKGFDDVQLRLLTAHLGVRDRPMLVKIPADLVSEFRDRVVTPAIMAWKTRHAESAGPPLFTPEEITILHQLVPPAGRTEAVCFFELQELLRSALYTSRVARIPRNLRSENLQQMVRVIVEDKLLRNLGE